MTDDEIRSLAAKLRRVANEMIATAKGSSRVAMYAALADELRVEASRLLAAIGATA